MIFHEAPHRLRATLADMAEAFGGDRKIALCRELTKLHELEEGVALVLRRREEGMRLKDAVRAVADDTGLSRNALYDAALKNLA